MAQKNGNAKAVIDRVNRTITVSKAFNAKASIYGTPEYDDLTKIQTDYPNYRIIVKNPSRKSVPLGKITRAQIEKYIKSHDDESNSIMVEFKIRCGTPIDPADQLPTPYTYAENKAWFLDKFKAVAKSYENRK